MEIIFSHFVFQLLTTKRMRRFVNDLFFSCPCGFISFFKECLKRVIRLCNGSFVLAFLISWIPDSVLDKMMTKKFGLCKISGEK
jgi:hypothetical protein